MHSALEEFVDEKPQPKVDPKSPGSGNFASGTVGGEMAAGSNIRVAKPRGSNILGAAIAAYQVPEGIISTKVRHIQFLRILKATAPPFWEQLLIPSMRTTAGDIFRNHRSRWKPTPAHQFLRHGFSS
jgi:hypothetical protein